MTAPYEVATNELRQVANGAFRYVQRKWLVQDGSRYEGNRRGAYDIDIAPDGILRSGIWLPARVEWRDLPTIDVKDL